MVQKAAHAAELASARLASDAELAHELVSRGWMLHWDSGRLRGILVPLSVVIDSSDPAWNPNRKFEGS
jgi:hypothetical protein